MKYLLLIEEDNTRTIINSDFITQVFVTDDDRTMAGIHLSDRQEPVCVKESVETIFGLLNREPGIAAPIMINHGPDEGTPLTMQSTTFGDEAERLRRAREPHAWTGLRQWGPFPEGYKQCTICDVPLNQHPIFAPPSNTPVKD